MVFFCIFVEIMRDYLSTGKPILLSGEITSDSEDTLRAIIPIVINCQNHEKVDRPLTHYKITKNVLEFWEGDYSVKEKGGIILPFPLTRENAFDFIYNCMKNVDENDISTEYSGDGSNGFGFTAKICGNFGDPVLTITVQNLYYSK